MHHNLASAVAIFLALLVGQFLHAYLLASNSVNSSLNGITSYGQYAHKNAAIVAYRFAALWAIVSIYSWEGAALCAYISQTIPGFGWLVAHPIPVNPATSMLVGLFGDPVLNSIFGLISRWIPQLKNEVPPQADGAGKIDDKKAA